MAIVNQQNVQVKSGSTWYKICPFPVGFIYLSQKSTSPATTFGGTWAALNEDRFLRPSNAWTTGGSKKISVDQMPSHTHGLGRNTVYTGADDYPAVSASRSARAGWYVGAATGTPPATGGGQGLLASIPRLLWLVSDCIVFTSWMEVNANDYIS